MGRLVDEVFNIIAEEEAQIAAENRRIDAAFPQPAPHVLQLTEEEIRRPAKTNTVILPPRTPPTP
jgi:hypothetical protein